MKTLEYSSIRISPRSKEVLRTLAKQEGKRMQAVLDEAIEYYRRDRFLDDVNAAFANLRSDPKAWKEEQAERALWHKTLNDGMDLAFQDVRESGLKPAAD
jgi:predicted DNA-binding protein